MIPLLLLGVENMKNHFVNLATSSLLLLLGAVWAIPFLWMTSAAFKSSVELIANTNWWPSRFTLDNFQEVWGAANFPILYGNTLWIVFVILIAQIIIAVLAAYAFARREFPGANLLFILCMIQLFVPVEILLLPNYEIMHQLGLIDSKWAIVLPYFASSFGIFYLRQAFKSVPKELEEAAIIDGANTWHILRHVYLPLTKPAIAALSITSVSFHWNDFLYPLIVTNSPSNRPITVGLAMFAQSSEAGAQWSALTAATLIVIGPLILIFIVFQRRIIESFMSTGLK